MSFNFYYQSGDFKTSVKMLALIHASETGENVECYFEDHIWENAAKNFVPGGININEVYKKRALELREKYDFISLNYSGGVDSWTALHTFIDNGIKIDQIVVRFPFSFLNKKLHSPNSINTHEFNRLSEWDFTVKPDLEILAKTHPEINIELVDWLEVNNLNVNEGNFTEIHGQYRFGSVLRMPAMSDTRLEKTHLDLGHSVCNLYGVDKPRLKYKNGKFFFHFNDGAMAVCPPRLDNLAGNEYFFWGSTNVALSQLHLLKQWFILNPQYIYCIDDTVKVKTPQYATMRWRNYAEIIKFIIYPKWDFNRFQCDKPSFGSVRNSRPGDVCIESRPELNYSLKKYHYLSSSYFNKIDKKFKFDNGELRQIMTKMIEV